MKKVIFSLVVMVALLSCLDANPFSLTGELRVPDAYVLPNKAAKVQVTSYLRKEESVPGSDFEPAFFGMLQVGILNRIELGIMGGDDIVFGNVKIKIVDETITYPQIAIGVDNLFSKVPKDAITNPPSGDMANNPDRAYYERNSAYIALSKQAVIRGFLGLPEFSAVFSGGFGTNRFVGQVVRSKQFEGLFVSAEISPFSDWVFVGEMDGHNLNLGAKYNWNNFSARLGYLGFEESLKSKNPNHRFALGVSYTYDKLADARRRPILPDSPYYEEGTRAGTQVVRPADQGTTTQGDIFEELKRIREAREQQQKLLEELRKTLQDLERDSAGQ